VRADCTDQRHLDLEERIDQVFAGLRRREQRAAGHHHDEPQLFPRTKSFDDRVNGNIGQRPIKEAEVCEQDQSSEYGDAGNVRRQYDRVNVRGFTDRREYPEVLDSPPDRYQSHRPAAPQVNA